ncbi:MAG TPA: hypothetical protein VEB43_11710 [Anaeromyxobacter sp.]|nr:hypothetical protein [Anaeromyxobacter sp.]
MTPIVPALPASAAGPAEAARAALPNPERTFGQVLERAGLPCRSELGAPAPAAPAQRLLEAVDRARARLDGVLAAARSGRTFTAQELLGLQAEAYRTTQTVDLAVKVAEQGAQSIRQALSAQV